MNETMHFETDINAPVEKVWETMLAPDTYKEWTSVFEPTSHYVGSWDKGSKIKFLGSDGSGMISQIADNVKYRYISIEHLGEIKNGVEDTTSESVKKWTPAFENYTFTKTDSGTHLKIDMELGDSEESRAMKKMFEDMWPNALLKLKEICER